MTGTMYKLLRKLGVRKCKKARKADIFTAQEYKNHFEKVSINRRERSE